MTITNVRHTGAVIAVLAATGSAAVASPDLQLRPLPKLSDLQLETRWPAVPKDHGKPLEDVVVDHLSDYGNRFGDRLDDLSHDLIGLHVDGRGQRARLRLGTGTGHFLRFRLDSDWLFSDSKARIHTTVELGVGTHTLELKLPAMDVSEDSYHGVQLVQVNVPLLERRF